MYNSLHISPKHVHILDSVLSNDFKENHLYFLKGLELDLNLNSCKAFNIFKIDLK